jgi:hypothetical protein
MNTYTAIIKRIQHDKALLLYIIVTTLLRGIILIGLAVCMLFPLLVLATYNGDGHLVKWMIENFIIFGISGLAVPPAAMIYALIYHPGWEKI